MPKKEIRKLPFIGRLGDRAGYIWLDRQNPTASKQAMDAAAAALKKRTFLIFPEGTRSGEGISGFKKGAFHVAIKAAGVRVVPVALAGADDLASLDPQRRLVRITFGTPIVVGGSESVDGLLTRVRKEVITLNLALGGRGAKPGTEEEHIALKGNPARKGNAAAVWLKV